MNKYLKKLLALIIAISMIPVTSYASEEEIKEVHIILDSVFFSRPVTKQFIVSDDMLYLDTGSLADLAGYSCARYGEAIVFQRGERKIAVTPDGMVEYFPGDSVIRKMDRAITYEDHIYLPFTTALRMLGTSYIADYKQNFIYVVANEISYHDNYAAWDINSAVFDYTRDLPIKSVKGVKLGIFLSTIIDKKFTYLANTIFLQGPNADKYRDAALYYLTFKAEDIDFYNSLEEADYFVDVFSSIGDFETIIFDENDDYLDDLLNKNLKDFFDTAETVTTVVSLTSDAVKAIKKIIDASKAETPQIESLRCVIKNADGSDRDGLGLSMYRGVGTAIRMGEGKYISFIEVMLNPILEAFTNVYMEKNDIGLPTNASLVLAGLNIGNSIMQQALAPQFEEMENYDTVFCLIDMQHKLLPEFERLRNKVINHAATKEEYEYLYYTTRFVYTSNIAIYDLLTEIYTDRKNSDDLIELWQIKRHNNKLKLYQAYTEDAARREAIPENLAVITESDRELWKHFCDLQLNDSIEISPGVYGIEKYREDDSDILGFSYALIIYEVQDNNITFAVEYVGSNWSPIYITEEITASVINNKCTFTWEDSWMNSGSGEAVFDQEGVSLRMIQEVDAGFNRGSLDGEYYLPWLRYLSTEAESDQGDALYPFAVAGHWEYHEYDLSIATRYEINFHEEDMSAVCLGAREKLYGVYDYIDNDTIEVTFTFIDGYSNVTAEWSESEIFDQVIFRNVEDGVIECSVPDQDSILPVGLWIRQ